MPCAFKCIILCPGSGSVLAQTCGAVNDITLIIMSERDLHAELRALELSTMRVGLIGLGTINTVVAWMRCVDDKVENAALVAVPCRNAQSHVEKSSWLPRDLQLTDSMDAFLTAGWSISSPSSQWSKSHPTFSCCVSTAPMTPGCLTSPNRTGVPTTSLDMSTMRQGQHCISSKVAATSIVRRESATSCSVSGPAGWGPPWRRGCRGSSTGGRVTLALLRPRGTRLGVASYWHGSRD